MYKVLITILTILVLGGCALSPPKNTNDLCAIFAEKKGWYEQARKASKRWGTSIPVMMAFAHQESGFRANARPPRKKILWVLPGPRPASAFGFSQAIDSTWKTYKKSTGRRGADRNDFGDAMDFIGWYNDQSQTINKISKTDAYNLYLAYHEGHGGFRNRSFTRKQWLKNVAERVASQSDVYSRQLQNCERSLNRGFLRRLLGER